MDSSGSKRRKTSPATSIRVNDQNTQLRHDIENGARTPSRRASFMSPTKSSLARFYPSLLPTANSTPPRRRGSSASQYVYSQGPKPNGLRNGGMVRRAKSTEPNTAKTTITPVLGAARNEQDLSATSRRRPWSPEGKVTPSKRAKVVPVEDIRASPPEEDRENDEVVGESQHTGQEVIELNGINTNPHQEDTASDMLAVNQSHLPFTPPRPAFQSSSSGMVLQENGEPSLPSTPVQLGLEKPPEPPKGLLYSSPSRNSPRKRVGRVKSSPLKLQTDDFLEPSLTPESLHSSLGPRVYISNTLKPPPTARVLQLFDMKGRLAVLERKLEEIEVGLLRNMLVSTWHDDDSKGEKDRLGLEKKALAVGTKVISLREELMQLENGDDVPLDSTNKQASDHETVEIPRNKATGTTTLSCPYLPTLSQRLNKFLPFSGRPLLPTLMPPSPQHELPSQMLNLGIPEAGVVPFKVTVSSATLLSSNPGSSLLQFQDIELSSPSQILLLKVQVTIDVLSQLVTDLQIMEMSDWAEAELGEWLRATSQKRSVASVGRAFGRYWMLCLQRLSSSDDVVRDFGNLITNVEAFGSVSSPPTNADITHVISRLCWRDLHIARDAVTLSIQWRVSIDDDGNIESDVLASPKFPESWRQIETGSQLDKVGEAFKVLVNDRGVSQAICMIAGLLFQS